jgi:hypothetical protein
MVCIEPMVLAFALVALTCQVAYSFGLAGSVKLNMLEESVELLMAQLPNIITRKNLDQASITTQLNVLCTYARMPASIPQPFSMQWPSNPPHRIASCLSSFRVDWPFAGAQMMSKSLPSPFSKRPIIFGKTRNMKRSMIWPTRIA